MWIQEGEPWVPPPFDLPLHLTSGRLQRVGREEASSERKGVVGSSSKKRQTMAKMTRERAVKEKRARKQEKKDEKKAAAAAARDMPEGVEDESIAIDEEPLSETNVGAA